MVESNKLNYLEKKWEDNTIAAATKYCEGIARVAGVEPSQLESAKDGICSRYTEGVKGKASKWAQHYLLALTKGITQEVRKE